jgi:hypothetical protein
MILSFVCIVIYDTFFLGCQQAFSYKCSFALSHTYAGMYVQGAHMTMWLYDILREQGPGAVHNPNKISPHDTGIYVLL